jgi:hypothetical protein
VRETRGLLWFAGIWPLVVASLLFLPDHRPSRTVLIVGVVWYVLLAGCIFASAFGFGHGSARRCRCWTVRRRPERTLGRRHSRTPACGLWSGPCR